MFIILVAFHASTKNSLIAEVPEYWSGYKDKKFVSYSWDRVTL